MTPRVLVAVAVVVVFIVFVDKKGLLMYVFPALSRSRSLSLIAVGALVLGLAAPVAVPQAAQAAVKCKGATCKGKDPSAMGCGADAKTITEFMWGETRVEVRRSTACHAVWARGTMPKNIGNFMGLLVGIVGYSCGDASTDCRKGYYITGVNEGEQSYTKMWDYTDWVRACIHDPAGEPFLPVDQCSNAV